MPDSPGRYPDENAAFNGLLERFIETYPVPGTTVDDAANELAVVRLALQRCTERLPDGHYLIPGWVDAEAIVQIGNQERSSRRTGRLVATQLPCPDWCEHADDHPFETTDEAGSALRLVGSDKPPERLCRVHRRRLGNRATHVAIETWERTDDASGPSDLGADPEATLVRLQLPEPHAYLTPEGARRLAQQLVEAAALCEESRP